MTQTRTRFAPSPTGYLHIGGLRTAAYAYALAKNQNGKFILRIEDTDQKREVPGARDQLLKTLKTFGLVWDEYYVQSERVETGIYQKAAEQLIKNGQAFYCQCEAKNAKKEGFSKELRDPCRDKGLTSGAIKLKVPDGQAVSYTDFVLRKQVEWETSSVADTTLLKSDGFPTYHLAVVVDDNDMKITHVLRGHDWMPSTPIHLLVYQSLELEKPEIGHLTDILDPDGGKLSKRKGSVSCESMITEGYLPEAIFNFVILQGWAPKDNRELFSLNDFVGIFDPQGFQKANPVFNRKKLDWFNGQYIRQKSDDELFTLLKPYAPVGMGDKLIKQSVSAVKERLSKLSDYTSLVEFVVTKPSYTKDTLVEKTQEKSEVLHEQLAASLEIAQSADWQAENIEVKFRELAASRRWHMGHYFMGIRLALTGKTISPPLFDSMLLLGKEETLLRLEAALKVLS